MIGEKHQAASAANFFPISDSLDRNPCGELSQDDDVLLQSA